MLCKINKQYERETNKTIFLSNGTQVLVAVTLGENGNVMQDKQTKYKREANKTIFLSNGTQVLVAVIFSESGNMCKINKQCKVNKQNIVNKQN